MAIALTVLESYQQYRRAAEITALTSGYGAEPQLVEESISGYASGLRHAIVNDRSDDLAWVLNVQTARDRGEWRLRRVAYDNAPEGRSVHWSSLYHWWLRGLAAPLAMLSQHNGQSAIEQAAYAANVALVTLVFLGMAWVAARGGDGGAGGALCLCLLGLLPFRDVFRYGMGDHHAAAILSSLLAILALALAVAHARSSTTRSVAGSSVCRALCVAAGVSGAAGLWINAVSQLPLLASLGLAGISMLALDWRSEASPERLLRMASLWRWWAASGSAASLVGYLTEYAPSKWAWRLEVNHPLLALAWLGIGELLCQLNRCASDRRGGEPAYSKLALTGALLALLPYPALVLLAREQVFQVADGFLMAIHNRYIMEFQSLVANVAVMPSPLRSIAMLLPFGLIPLALLLAILGDRKRRGPLVIALSPAVVYLSLTLLQARWWSQSAALLTPLAVLLLAQGPGFFRTSLLATRLRIGAILCLLPGLLFTLAYAVVSAPVSSKERLRAVERGVAHYLRTRGGESDLVALASPDASLSLAYYGGIAGVGTFYWENIEGLRRAATYFGSSDDEETRALLRDAGITHLVMYSWGGFEERYAELYREFVDEGGGTGASTLMRLVREQRFPLWLKPIPYRLPQEQGLEQEVALLFELVEPMSPARAAAAQFEFYLEMGWNGPAFGMEAPLEARKDELVAAVSLARLYALSGREERFLRLVDELTERVESEAVGLDAETRVRLAGVLAIARRGEAARRELSVALQSLDAAALRSFNSDSVMHLLELMRALRLDWPDAELRQTATDLLPDRHRRRLANLEDSDGDH